MTKRHDPHDEPLARVGETIAARRLALGLTQEQLARMIDVGQEFISRIERKATPPKLETLLKICYALNCSVDDLLQQGTPAQTDEQLAAIAIAMRDLTGDERNSVVSIVQHVSEVLRQQRLAVLETKKRTAGRARKRRAAQD